MIFRAGNRFDKENYFLTEIDTSVPTCEVSGELNGVPVDWEVGGGSTDFSTAQVTLVNATEHSLQIVMLPLIYESEEFTTVVSVYPPYIEPDEDPIPVTVPLYKGKCVWTTAVYTPYLDYNFSGSGNVTVIPEEGFIITGDCTITISSNEQG